jgi:hypothetical protein
LHFSRQKNIVIAKNPESNVVNIFWALGEIASPPYIAE